MAPRRTFKLNTGYEIPAVGLGTWQSKPSEVQEAVTAALNIGYRHIDAAAVYGNEREVGNGIKASDVPREEIFLTSKLWNTNHEPENVEAALDRFQQYLGQKHCRTPAWSWIHWPVAFRYSTTTIQPVDEKTDLVDVIDVPIKDTWAAMEALVAKGKVRSIGVSNFTREKIEELLKTAKIPPAVNQIGAHPYLQQRELLEWSKEKVNKRHTNNIYNIPPTVEDPLVIEIAESLNKTPAQVLISWAVQRGSDFILPEDAFQAIQSLERHQRMNFPARLGVDIFGEVGEESVKRSGLEWAEGQRLLKSQA
ncbi:NADP-dependent oxidoreductase domain-containing protein [Aspergillus desertorum]